MNTDEKELEIKVNNDIDKQHIICEQHDLLNDKNVCEEKYHSLVYYDPIHGIYHYPMGRGKIEMGLKIAEKEKYWHLVKNTQREK